MRLIRNYHALYHEPNRYVATIGNFDGLHGGHQSMLTRLKAVAANENAKTCVIIFEPLPQEYFSPYPLPRLMRLREKINHFKQLNIDLVICLRFNQKMANLSANTFIEEVLVSALKLKALVVGDDFRFGYMRQGDVETLKVAGDKHHFDVYQINSIYQNYKRISSTQIRHALKEGDLGLAKRLLGRDYGFSGRVVYGSQLGRTLGFPTANFAVQEHFPLHGVYLTRVKGLAEEHFAVTNVGVRPTLQRGKRFAEAHLLNFSGNLYGKRLTLEFLYKLRDEKKFSNVEALKTQISKDKSFAENLMTSMVGE